MRRTPIANFPEAAGNRVRFSDDLQGANLLQLPARRRLSDGGKPVSDPIRSPGIAQRRASILKKSRPGEVRVLIVDDDRTVCVHVDKMLRLAGYTTLIAADGPQALEIAASAERLDLLVVDLLMPGMNGDELTTRLRHTHRQLPVVYLTGFPEHLFRNRGGLWENERLLEKPCTMQELLEAVDSLLGGSASEQA